MRFCIAIFCMAMSLPLFAAESEYDVKATYIFNFARLVKWPASAYSGPTAPMIIGVVGRDPVGGGLGSALRGQKAGGRDIEVRSVSASDTDALQSCHLIYVGASQRVGDIARALQGRPVLIVGESEDFASAGGIIGFVKREQKIKLEINNDAARRLQLKIPSDLLGMAKIVN